MRPSKDVRYFGETQCNPSDVGKSVTEIRAKCQWDRAPTHHQKPRYIDASRLLLDPLKNHGVFQDATVNTLANPYVLVREDSEFLLAEQASSEPTMMRRTGLITQRRCLEVSM